jgi:CDP-diacylglycerol--serine O-phosphatidyltransferase
MRALIPNTLSLSNLVLGFISILVGAQYATTNNPDTLFWAAILIIIAALCDGLDGPAARLLKVREGGIGEQLDSLADMVTFGAAPGALLYHAYFHKLGVVQMLGLSFPSGLLLASLFPVTAAYRLARFNLSHDPASFRGLPSPIAGVGIALFFILRRGDLSSEDLIYILPIYIMLALLMVSTIKYNKPQPGLRSNYAPLRILVLVLFILGLTFVLKFSLIEILLALLGLYIFVGLAAFVILTIKRLKV